ncbi:peptidoglycan-binding protein [Alkalihalophilus lindianensis]|uniref:Peptidoglycan-binding protein n=1 Tax=Alkalihalophilus lindianensis TaxID=1630542 RepID=A0ABU3XDN4_9BACI|nr:peptidoglycan-binding protein [Alkalihalophilus lindianensis]MDV2685544.1 peptidoglycan-binding protein [Alkalihalophilus lindianensis]
MKKQPHSKILRNFGLPLATAGVLLFASPAISEASDVGSNLLKKGVEGESVHLVQELLHEKGLLDKAEITGTFSKETAKAVSTYQEKHGLVVDGIAGPQTVGAIKVLEAGDEGDYVEDLQGQLLDLGFYEGNKDGLFGPLTHAAVKGFQSAQGIQVDGIAGPETYANLYYTNPATPAVEKPVAATPAEEAPAEEPVAEEPVAEEPTVEAPTEEAPVETALETEEAQEPAEQPAEEPSEETVEEPAATEEPAVEEAEVQEEEAAPTSSDQATFEMEATAYTAYCEGCSGVTATGIDLRENPDQKVVAVDPSVIPLGSRVHVEGYGEAIAGDTGGAIQGNKVDLYMASKDDAINFGRQTVTVTVLD